MRESVLIVPYNSVLSFSLGLWPDSPTRTPVHLHTAPKTMRCCRASSQGHSGPSPGAGVLSDKSMPDLLSELNRSFVVSSVRMSARLELRFPAFPPFGTPCVASSTGTWPPPAAADCLAIKEKRIPVHSHMGFFEIKVFIAALAGIKTCDAIQTALIKSST